MSQKIAAIEVHGDVARLALWEASLRKAELIALERIALTPGTSPWPEVRARVPKEVDSTILVCDARSCSTRRLSLPFSDLRKVQAAVDFELESQIPYELTDAASTWTIAHKGAQGVHVLTALMRKEPLRAMLAELSTLELEPRAVVHPAAVLPELVDLAPPSAECVGILSIDADVTHLAIVSGTLQMLRTVQAGLAISDDAALSRLASELGATIRALPAELRPMRLYLLGSEHTRAAEYLQYSLGADVTLLDVRDALREVTLPTGNITAEFAPVVAAGLSLLRHGRQLPLDFRRGDLAYAGDFEAYRGQLWRAGIAAGAVLLLFLVGGAIRLSALGAEEKEINQGFCETTQRVTGREICDPTAALATLRQAPGAGGGADAGASLIIPAYSASALFQLVSERVGQSLDVTFDELEFQVDGSGRDDRIVGRAEAGSFEVTESLATALKADPCVGETEISKQRKTGDKRVEFHLNVKVACPAGVVPGRGAIP